MKLPQRRIQEQDRRHNESMRPARLTAELVSISTTKGAIKTWTPDLGQLSHQKHPTDNAGGIAVRRGRKSVIFLRQQLDKNQLPHPRLTGSGQGPLLLKLNRVCSGRRLHLRSVCDPGLLPTGENPVLRSVAQSASRRHALPSGSVQGDVGSMGMLGVWARKVEPFVRPGFLPGRRLEPVASAAPASVQWRQGPELRVERWYRTV